MNKKHFIREVVVRSLPELDRLPQAIEYAENLWQGLSAKGYGDIKQHATRENKDWHKALSDGQRLWFGRFWTAFKYKHGRDGAAMRWAQLGELSAEEYQLIIKAAAQEGQRLLADGQVRKMAQGWLEEKRYNDYEPPVVSKKIQQNHVLNRLVNELNGIKRLYDQGGDEALLPQIIKLEQAIKDARQLPRDIARP